MDPEWDAKSRTKIWENWTACSFFLNHQFSFQMILMPVCFLLAEKIEASSTTTIKTFNRNFILQDSSTNGTKERNSTPKDLIVSHLCLNASFFHYWWHLQSAAILSVDRQSELPAWSVGQVTGFLILLNFWVCGYILSALSPTPFRNQV